MDRQEELRDILRGSGKSALLAEAEQAGLSPKQNRMRCPFEGCRDQGEDKARNVALYIAESGIYKLKCWRCTGGGSLLDLLMATRGMNLADAITYLKSNSPSAPPLPPRLALIHSKSPTDPEKLTPEQVKRIWDKFTEEDKAGEEYLVTRGIARAADMGFVKFAPGKCGEREEKDVMRLAARGWTMAMLCRDVTGNPLGIQLRLTREAVGREPKILAVTGSTMKGAYLGDPGAIETSFVVCVTEGMVDTASVAVWSHPSAAVVGVPGRSMIYSLGKELIDAGIPLEGKIFVLFPDNDRPRNESRREFKRLSQVLHKAGATVVVFPLDPSFKDIGEWRAANPDVAWPPPQLSERFDQHGLDDVPEEEMDAPEDEKHSIRLPAQITTDFYQQNLVTLGALLDDPVSREAIIGDGEFSTCEMTHRPLFNEKALSDTDFTAMRVAIETHGRTTENKPLRYSEEDIVRMTLLLARRKYHHPVRAFLSKLSWDKTPRLDVGLPAAFGYAPGCLEAVLLRKFMISCVARAMEPGCQMETALVLIGNQGAYKSSFFRAIGGRWFTDEPMMPGDKDSKMVLRKFWIVEWAELSSMRRAKDVEEVKGFISKRDDDFRPPYGKDLIAARRSCVIVGTSNTERYLNDPSGARRFWTVRVSKIDIDWVREHREQLLAEALVAFDAGEKWHLQDAALEAQLASVNEEHTEVDPWHDMIAEYLERNKLDAVTIPSLLSEALSKPVGQWTRSDETRVGIVLHRLGFSGSRIRSGGVRVHRYVRASI